MRRISTIGVFLLGVDLSAHPPISKVVTTHLPEGTEMTVSCQSTPVQEIAPSNAPVDRFLNPGLPGCASPRTWSREDGGSRGELTRGNSPGGRMAAGVRPFTPDGWLFPGRSSPVR